MVKEVNAVVNARMVRSVSAKMANANVNIAHVKVARAAAIAPANVTVERLACAKYKPANVSVVDAKKIQTAENVRANATLPVFASVKEAPVRVTNVVVRSANAPKTKNAHVKVENVTATVAAANTNVRKCLQRVVVAKSRIVDIIFIIVAQSILLFNL